MNGGNKSRIRRKKRKEVEREKGSREMNRWRKTERDSEIQKEGQ